jgi:hypothetical protein
MTEKVTTLTRPVIAYLLTGMIVGAVFTDRIGTFPDWLVGLCLLVIPGYMGLRSLEKAILPKLNGTLPAFTSKTNGG